jgi:hypothetical protein
MDQSSIELHRQQDKPVGIKSKVGNFSDYMENIQKSQYQL